MFSTFSFHISDLSEFLGRRDGKVLPFFNFLDPDSEYFLGMKILHFLEKTYVTNVHKKPAEKCSITVVSTYFA
jgi:hypothetical protein